MNGQLTGPIKILVSAIGGEGGGVMTKWLKDLGEAQGVQVRYTYVPGVAQRTGAATYYLEIWPTPVAPADQPPPIGALMPCAGDVDLMLSTEAVEAARALQRGFITKSRTHVVTSTHRVYAVNEKAVPGDGRVDARPMLAAVEHQARSLVRFDMAAAAAETGSVINAVLFGALAGSTILPFPAEAFAAVIGGGANLRGFELGHSIASGGATAPVNGTANTAGRSLGVEDLAAMENSFPPELHAVLRLGMERTADFQDAEYARAYLAQLGPVLEADRATGGADQGFLLTRETGRWLARLMAYDDVIRVADLKTRRSRFERVRDEVRADDGQVVRITDYLRPGIEEIASILSPGNARRLLAFSARTGFWAKGMPLKLRTSSVTGFLAMRGLALLKSRRRSSHRFAAEQAAINAWLEQVRTATGTSYELGLEVAACAQLIKGYGATHCRGSGNFAKLLETAASSDAVTVRRLRQAAMADDTGAELARAYSMVSSG